MTYKVSYLVGFLLVATMCLAQEKDKKMTYTAYGELYYSNTFPKSASKQKEPFFYNHKKNNVPSINLLFGKAAYATKNVRANVAAMLGNYATNNLAAEPNWAQYILEANAGIKLSKKENIWLDVGVLPSHIGFESAISADCWTLTRSLLAENSPYYETGTKLTYTTKNEKITAAALVLNGWQKIKTLNGIKKPSYGIQLIYKPTDKLTLNYSGFYGRDKPDTMKVKRIFSNFYSLFEPNKKWGFIIGLDKGIERYKNNNNANWFAPVIITRYTIDGKTKIGFRLEKYQDIDGVIVSTNNFPSFDVRGISINLDYAISKRIQWRIEAKTLKATNIIFDNGKDKSQIVTSNLTIKF